MKTLFSWSGRMDRGQYLAYSLLMCVLCYVGSGVFDSAGGRYHMGFRALVGLLIMGTSILGGMAVNAKRFQDFNCPGVFLALLRGGLWIAEWHSVLSSSALASGAFTICDVLVGLILLLVPGNKTANEYGPVPGEEEEEPTTVRTVSVQPAEAKWEYGNGTARQTAAKPEYVKPAAASTQMPKPAAAQLEYVKPAAQSEYVKPAAQPAQAKPATTQPAAQPVQVQPAVKPAQFTLAAFVSLQAAAEKLVEQCFLFTDYTGRSISFAERLELYTVFGLVPSQISEGEKNWLSFEITMLRFFRLKELLRSDTASADQIRLAAELDIAFRAKYQSNASYLSIVNNRLVRYEPLARECGGDIGKFYEKAAPIVFATANIEDERLRLHMLSQEVAAWESLAKHELV